MTRGRTPGAIDFQIMWNRLIAVVEEQATTLIRTAFSTSVREAGDLSAGLFDRAGRMMAQAVTGTPGHVNAMAESVGHFLREIGPQNLHDGDVLVTNDPWMGTGHLHDITMVTPVFRGGVHIGFFACTAHVVDIGGRGFGPDAGEVFEEGLLIPICKFAERGRISPLLVQLVRANVRTPDQTVGDMYSLAACNAAGERRLQAMMDEFAIADLDGLSDFILDASRRATRDAIARVPDGRYGNAMTVDGYDAPVEMVVTLDIDGDRLTADFTGTSGMSAFGVNVPEVYTRAYACYGLKCAIAPEVPNNAGSLEPFEISAPDGCILAARRPAPVSVRHVLGHLVPDVVLGALHQALPGMVPAEGASALWNIQISARPRDGDGPPAEVLMFNSGGTGARPGLDGLSATAFPSGVSTMSVEATEHVGPITVWRKDLRPGSGGAGMRRGGLGQVIEIEPRAGYDMWFNAMFDRVANPARGREGGGAGAPGRVELADGTPLRPKGRQQVAQGQRLRLSLPGGGGYGDPQARDRAAVAADLDAGLITEDEARNLYGSTGDDG
jgi:N-methylhydantoinase B